MNYKIITDETILSQFIEDLPNTSDLDLRYYCCLFARSKYLTEEQKGTISHIKSDKSQLKMFVATKENIITKLKQLECPVGSYIQYKTNVPSNPVPQESLAVYMTINPRSLQKATKNSLKKFVEMVIDNPTHSFNPSNFAMSEIQRSRGRTDYVVFDVDSKELSGSEIKERVREVIATDNFKILETRGGYHILIPPKTQISKGNFYNEIQKRIPDIDQAGDIMIPIPGTYQGGHTPKFII